MNGHLRQSHQVAISSLATGKLRLVPYYAALVLMALSPCGCAKAPPLQSSSTPAASVPSGPAAPTIPPSALSAAPFQSADAPHRRLEAACRASADPQPCMELVSADRNAGDLQQAERDLKAIRQRFPHYPAAAYLLGTLYLNVNRNQEALEPLITAARLDARNADAQLMAGLAYFRVGRYEQAIQYTNRAVKITPDASAPYLLQARIFGNHGTVEQGITALHNYLARAKNPAPGYYMLGRLYYRRRRRAEAEDAIRRSLQADPNNADYWAILGHIYCELDGGAKSDQGVEAYNKALALRPDDAETQAALGRALMSRGQWNEAVPHLRTALSNSADPAPILYSLATALMRSGHQVEGRQVLAEYAAVTRDHASANKR